MDSGYGTLQTIIIIIIIIIIITITSINTQIYP
jgi:hypothetical protein